MSIKIYARGLQNIDGGGAASHFVEIGETAANIVLKTDGMADRSLSFKVGTKEGQIEFPSGNFDLSHPQVRADLLADLNAQLTAEFGEAGFVKADFKETASGYNLIFTSAALDTGASMEIKVGESLKALGLADAELVPSTSSNNKAIFKIDGEEIEVAIHPSGEYPGEELAQAIQNQIRSYGATHDIESLLEAKVSFSDGKFSIESGKRDQGVIEVSSPFAEMLGLIGEGIEVIAGFAGEQKDLKLQIGANSEESVAIDIGDVRAKALKVSSSDSGATVNVQGGGTAHYVQILGVANGTNSVDVEYALDVSDHEKATAALSVIGDAIEAVSTVRSKLGAYQNRLEHTISNLSNSAENMLAAESRIRDLDMAEEMMAFTKENILQQSAIAMLAQANLAPQNILQLLG